MPSTPTEPTVYLEPICPCPTPSLSTLSLHLSPPLSILPHPCYVVLLPAGPSPAILPALASGDRFSGNWENAAVFPLALQQYMGSCADRVLFMTPVRQLPPAEHASASGRPT